MAAMWWMNCAAYYEENNLRIFRRRLRDLSDPFGIPDTQFRALYRLDKDTTYALCEELRVHMEEGIRSTSIPLELKVLASLSFFASGSYQRRIGQDFLTSMCQSSVSGSLHAVVNALNNIMHQWIKFPTEHEEMQEIKQQFWNETTFPGVIGAIDGTHVAIWPPTKEREHLYINRKLYHSLNVMLVSDYKGRILAVNAGHGGRTHDSRVWNASHVSAYLDNQYVMHGQANAWLLGDSGYPLLPYLLTPKLNQPAGLPSALYTEKHIKARCCVERCIGKLKGRWRCLRKERALHYDPEFAALIINATCVLHNIAQKHNIPAEIYLDEIDEENFHDDMVVLNRRAAGHQNREDVIRRYFT